MKRRDAIKNLVFASGGLMALPSWAIGWKADVMANYNTAFTDYEIAIISSIVDIIIPSNGEIGGLSVGVDQFLVGLISRCYEEEVQGDIRAGLYDLDYVAKDRFGKKFTDCEKPGQEKLLLAMQNEEDENGNDFFGFMKAETIRGFRTSKEVMLNYHGYVMMPGFYDGNVNVQD